MDEAQDLSPLNHQQLLLCAGPDGPGAARIVAVGDPRQAIYAFRGADPASMDRMRPLRGSWVDLSLRLSFRCPKLIVERQQRHAPGFAAAEGNARGEVVRWEGAWGWGRLQDLLRGVAGGRGDGAGSCAVLCRNNAPLFAVAVALVRDGVPCCILGRDMLQGLAALSRRICGEGDGVPAEECRRLISAFKAEAEAEAAGRRKGGGGGGGTEPGGGGRADSAAELSADRAGCLLAVLDSGGGGGAGRCATAGDLRARLAELFEPGQERVALATIHQAKGLEWDVVVHLDPWRIPHPRADGDGLRQEWNLLYVAETRARRALVLADAARYDKGRAPGVKAAAAAAARGGVGCGGEGVGGPAPSRGRRRRLAGVGGVGCI